MATNTFTNAVADIAEVFMFEQWLRQYFVVEKDAKLFIEIPQDALKEIYEAEQHLGPLADMFNSAEIDYQKCQATVCSFVGARYDGSKYGADVIARALDSKAFKVEMYVFGVWLKGHEQYLDERRMPFSEWREMYAGWNSMEQVKEYRKKLMAGGGAPNEPATKTVH